MKRVISILLCVLISVSLLPVAAFADSRDISLEESLAYDLKQLTLFQGVSDTDFALGRAPSRIEAIVMLIRILGKETEALEGNWGHPFTDVAKWADKYVGYAYQKGLTDGISSTRFGTGTASAQMYVTFVLRALGYSDANGDFSWDSPFELASSIGILPDIVDKKTFWRADVVSVSYAALSACLKDSTQTLAEKLISAGVFTQDKFDAIYDTDIFNKQDSAVTITLSQEELHQRTFDALKNWVKANYNSTSNGNVQYRTYYNSTETAYYIGYNSDDNKLTLTAFDYPSGDGSVIYSDITIYENGDSCFAYFVYYLSKEDETPLFKGSTYGSPSAISKDKAYTFDTIEGDAGNREKYEALALKRFCSALNCAQNILDKNVSTNEISYNMKDLGFTGVF